MALPACEERTLSGIEGALAASEPRLASMFSIFTRLCAGEPVGREMLRRSRRGLLRIGNATYAALVLPVMFIMVIMGILIGGTAHGASACPSAYPAAGGATMISRVACSSSCASAVPPASYTSATGTSQQQLLPPARGAVC